MKTKSKPAAATTAAPSAPAAGLKRINLAGISTKSAATKTAKAYPLLPDEDGQVAALVEGILEKSEQLEAIEGALEIEKAELIAIAKPFYFAHHAGQMAVASSIEARSGDQTIRVGFSDWLTSSHRVPRRRVHRTAGCGPSWWLCRRPAAMAQFGFDDESSQPEAAAVVSDRGFGPAEVLEPLQPLRTTIDPVLPALRPMVEPDIDAASDVDALIESCGFQPQVARAYRAAEIADEDEDCPEYLGRLSANPYAVDSTANPYSTAGSPYSSKSVNNQFGPYGSPFSPTSARNPYATDAPKIVAQDGTYLGELSDNPYDPDSVANPYGRYGSPYSPRSARNPLATDAPRIVAEDGTYLGELSANSYDPDSISNPFGRYGSPYSSTSIRNPYSPYGSPYSSQSPNNPYTARAPLLFGQ